ncbi:TPA: hypothetical protein ACGBG5_001221, partial [Enterococcus faecalis]
MLNTVPVEAVTDEVSELGLPDPITTVDAEGDLGTIHWYLTPDGVLHLGGGDLPNWVDIHSFKSPFDSIKLSVNKVVFDDTVVAVTSLSGLFYGLSNLTEIEHLEKLNTANATNMSNMFG